MAEGPTIDGSNDELLTCPLCKAFLQLPVRLSCLHFYCKHCLQKLPRKPNQGRMGWICSVCDTFTPESEANENTLLETLLAIKRAYSKKLNNICQFCEQPQEDLQFCTDCIMCICGGCLKIHKRTPVAKDHHISEAFMKEFSYCSKHIRNRYESYCETCEESVCKDCLPCHIGHIIKLFNKTRQDNFSTLNDLIRNLQPKLENQLELINLQLTKIQNKFKRFQNVSNFCHLLKKIEFFKNQSNVMEMQSALIKQAKELSYDDILLQNISSDLGQKICIAENNILTKDQKGYTIAQREDSYHYLKQNFKIIKTIKLGLKMRCHRLSTIGTSLYIAEPIHSTIQEYNSSGEFMKTYNDTFQTVVIKQTSNFDTIACGFKGVFVTNCYFSKWTQIYKGRFSDIVTHGSKFSALDIKLCQVLTFSLCNDEGQYAWKFESRIDIKAGPIGVVINYFNTTFTVDTGDNVIVCCKNTLLVYSSCGDYIKTVSLGTEYYIADLDNQVILCEFVTGKIYRIKNILQFEPEDLKNSFLCKKYIHVSDMKVDSEGYLWILHGCGRYFLSKYGPYNLIQSERDTEPFYFTIETVIEDFNECLKNDFLVTKSTDISNEWCDKVEVIDESLYVAVDSTIKQYNSSGECVRIFEYVQRTIVIKRVPYTNDRIAGGHRGLYIVNSEFSQWSYIQQGCYCDIAIHGNSFSALEFKEHKVDTFTLYNNYHQQEWKPTSSIDITPEQRGGKVFNSNATLSLDKHENVIVCNLDTLLVYSSSGVYVKTIELPGAYRITGTDRKGNIMLCDFWTGKIHSVANIHTLDVSDMESYCVCQKNALMHDLTFDSEGNMWILHGNYTSRLSKYEPMRKRTDK